MQIIAIDAVEEARLQREAARRVHARLALKQHGDAFIEAAREIAAKMPKEEVE